MPFPRPSSNKEFLGSSLKVGLFALIAIAVIVCAAAISVWNLLPDNEQIPMEDATDLQPRIGEYQDSDENLTFPPINNDLISDGYLIDIQDPHFNVYYKEEEPWTYFELFDKDMNLVTSEPTKHIQISYLTDTIISIYNSSGSPVSCYLFYNIESNGLTGWYEQAYLFEDRVLAFPTSEGNSHFLNIMRIFDDTVDYKFEIEYDCYFSILMLGANIELVDGTIQCNYFSQGEQHYQKSVSFPLSADFDSSVLIGEHTDEAESIAEIDREILMTYGAYEVENGKGSQLQAAPISLYQSPQGYEWRKPGEIPQEAYYYFYLHQHHLNGRYYDELIEIYPDAEGGNLLFPQLEYEELIQAYFDVSTEYLRDSDRYDANQKGYVNSQPPGFGEQPYIQLDRVEQDGEHRMLYITLDYSSPGNDDLAYILSVDMKDNEWQYVSFIHVDSEAAE